MISVIVCTYNRCESLKQALRSLLQLRAPSNGWELIVVDNNSNDDTAEAVKRFASESEARILYVFEANQGLSHARNAGVNAANGEIIAFTDDDVTVDSGWLCELQETFDRFDCSGVGGRTFPVWSSPRPSWLCLDGSRSLRHGAIVSFDHGEEHQEVTTVFGANMAFRRIVFEAHGLFRTDLGKRGNDAMTGEDTEFCIRISGAGQKIVYAPHAVVYHPVPRHRLKNHFQSYYFSYGRYTARVHGFPQGAILWFGVPRYMFRALFTHIYRWLPCFDRHRFRHKLQVYETLGAIREAHRMSQRRHLQAIGDSATQELTAGRPRWNGPF